jgi:hypothetical protein
MKLIVFAAGLLLAGCSIPVLPGKLNAEDVSNDIDRVSGLGRPTFGDPRDRMSYNRLPAPAPADGGGAGRSP